MQKRTTRIAAWSLHVVVGCVMLLFLTAILVSSQAQACTLRMGYQNKMKLPFIQKAPDNSGVYLDLYTAVAAKVGCQLEVIRSSKKRIMRDIKQGKIDFFPGMKITEKRSKFAYFIPNGLFSGRIGFSRVGMDPITDLSQLKGLTVLIALGGINYVEGVKGVKYEWVADLGMKRAANMIRHGRGDFFGTDMMVINRYLDASGIRQQFQVHPECCGGTRPMYMGFARKSSHFKETENPNFDPGKPISQTNQPSIMEPGTVAHAMAEALATMNIGKSVEP